MDRRSALGVIAGMMVAPLGVPAGTPLSEKGGRSGHSIDYFDGGNMPSFDCRPMMWIMHRGDGFYSWVQPIGGEGHWQKMQLSEEVHNAVSIGSESALVMMPVDH